MNINRLLIVFTLLSLLLFTQTLVATPIEKKILNSLYIDKRSTIIKLAMTKNNEIISLSKDNLLRRWRLDKRGLISLLKTNSSSPLTTFTLSNDEKYILLGTQTGSLELWNTKGSKCLLKIDGHQAPITDVIFTTHGKYFFSASEDMTIKMWRSHDGALIKSFEEAHKASIPDFLIGHPKIS